MKCLKDQLSTPINHIRLWCLRFWRFCGWTICWFPEFSSSWVWCRVNVGIDPLFLQLLASVRIILKLDNFDSCYSSIVRNLPILLICRYASYMCGNLNAILSFRYLLTEQYVLQLPVQVYHNWWYRFSPTSPYFKCITTQFISWMNIFNGSPD